MFPLKDHHPSGIFPILTYLVIAICAYVLFLEYTSPNLDNFIIQWSLVPSMIDFEKPKTLINFITATFLHGGLLHFLSNMWFLWIFGDNVEARLGKIGFLLFYITGGIAAGLVQYFFLIGEDIPILGASGAIAALLGFYLVQFPRSRIETLVFYPFLTVLNLPVQLVLGLWFLTQFLSGATNIIDSASGGGIAWWAHIGGFVYGYVIGLIIPRKHQI